MEGELFAATTGKGMWGYCECEESSAYWLKKRTEQILSGTEVMHYPLVLG